MKKKLIISYLIWGALTTVVNITVYYILTQWVGIPYLISNFSAWVMAVLFAYITNKRFVFNSSNKRGGKVSREILYFFCGRMLTGAVDMGLMFLLVSILSVNDIFSKLVVNVTVVVLNFIISKYIIFV